MEFLNLITHKTLLTKYVLATLLAYSMLIMVTESYSTTKISVTNHITNSSYDVPIVDCFNYVQQFVHKKLAKNEKFEFEVELKHSPESAEIVCYAGQHCRDALIYRTMYDEWRSIDGKTSFYVTLNDTGVYRYEVRTKVWRKLKQPQDC
ncbi:hypothetical protein RND81_08G205700 [Saponaria officinalis]|uniref:Uncharacterized protein n=1 Tax=Saponaria officinalis TaxID=3572 RepID=A0AAW1JB30_SAPOF